MKNKVGAIVMSSALLGSLVMAGTAFAAGPQGIYGPTQGAQEQGQSAWSGHGSMPPGVLGSVSAINGDTLTVTSKGFGRSASTTPATVYSVDATNATVFKDNATSSVSAITVGDMIMVAGTVSGDSVTATTIRDGMPQMGMSGRGMPGQGGMGGHATSTPRTAPYVPQGNGEPVVGGSVASVDGTTLTITNTSNVTYTVDASSAAISVKGATSTVSSIVVGDNVVVQGSVDGNAVTASSIIDQGASKAGTGSGSGGPVKGSIGGFIGVIGGFFQHIFGFF